MKSDAVSSNWKPTLTLARLFEEQNQFYDALAIYEIISQSNDSPEIRQKVEYLQSRIMNDPNMRYDERIEKLFSQEELSYLKIMNHSAFENLSRMQKQYAQGESDYEVVLDEEDLRDRPTVSSFELRRMVGEIDELADRGSGIQTQEEDDATIADLQKELIKRFGKDSKLNDISVQEFMQLLQEYNLLAKFSNKK
jgi:hypothetical protein